MPHVVINEVLANPVGGEPAQEWVELYNDGRAPAVLDPTREESLANHGCGPYHSRGCAPD